METILSASLPLLIRSRLVALQVMQIITPLVLLASLVSTVQNIISSSQQKEHRWIWGKKHKTSESWVWLHRNVPIYPWPPPESVSAVAKPFTSSPFSPSAFTSQETVSKITPSAPTLAPPPVYTPANDWLIPPDPNLYEYKWKPTSGPEQQQLSPIPPLITRPEPELPPELPPGLPPGLPSDSHGAYCDCDCGVSSYPPATVPTYPSTDFRSLGIPSTDDFREGSATSTSTTTEESTTPDRVAEEDFEDRIVGGVIAEPHQFPWLVLLVLQTNAAAPATPWCGGALVSKRYLVSAAHCVRRVAVSHLKAVLGLHDRCSSDNSSVTISVETAVPHPRFESRLLANDVAVLRLVMPVTFGPTIAPVCMPRPGTAYWGYLGEIAGWGKTNYGPGNPPSCVLIRAALPVLSRAVCSDSRYRIRQITRSHFCAGDIERGGLDACQGDSGGPLVVARGTDGRYELVGVVSGGQGCAVAGFPGLYTRIVDFLPWIANLTQDDPFCTKPLLN